MILLTRLGGQPLAVNPDLIERAEATPDTIITMSDGHKLVVTESLRQLVALVRRWRAEVAAESFELSGITAPSPRRALTLAAEPDDDPTPTAAAAGTEDDVSGLTPAPDSPADAVMKALASHPSLGAKVVRLPFVED
ncbi:MAG: flagellar FlbD family protein [Kineosporiaceae bacterium]